MHILTRCMRVLNTLLERVLKGRSTCATKPVHAVAAAPRCPLGCWGMMAGAASTCLDAQLQHSRQLANSIPPVRGHVQYILHVLLQRLQSRASIFSRCLSAPHFLHPLPPPRSFSLGLAFSPREVHLACHGWPA